MICTRFARAWLLLLMVAVMVLFSAFSVCAGEVAKFSLFCEEVKENRLFEVTLGCDSDKELSAFVAQLDYDPEMLMYHSASVTGDTAQYSVNPFEKGRITAVYFDEDGVLCSDSAGFMSIKFKALRPGNTDIQLAVKDAITPDSENVEVSECSCVQITISESMVVTSENTEISESAVLDLATNTFAEETDFSFAKDTTDISGKPVSNQTIVSVALSFVCLLCLAVYISYKAGVHRQKEKQSPAPLVYKDKAGKNKNGDEF